VSAPWKTLSGAGLALAGCGVAGAVYAMVVIRRARSQPRYRPQLEDWVWHAALPLLAYIILTVAASVLPRYTEEALSLIAAVTLGLVFIGIHNSWDTITYIVIDSHENSEDTTRRQ